MKHILKSSDTNDLINKQWRPIVDFRNVIAHEYFGLDEAEIFELAKTEILAFEIEFIEFIKMADNALISQALATYKEDLKNKKRNKSIAYLKTIEKMLET